MNLMLYSSLRGDLTMTLKNVLKPFILSLFIICAFLTMTSSSNAFNAVDEAKAISSNPEIIYTVYIGMPHSAVEQNFNPLKGWKKENRKYEYSLYRKYSDWTAIKAGASLEQRMIVTFDKNNYTLSTFSSFTTDNQDLATKIYDVMYQNLKTQYGEPKNVYLNKNTINCAKWLVNNHTYELAEMTTRDSTYTYLLIRPIENFDY